MEEMIKILRNVDDSGLIPLNSNDKTLYITHNLISHVFEYLDIYHLSKSCFLVSKTFLRLSIFRIQNKPQLDRNISTSSNHVNFCQDKNIETFIFYPYPSLWNLVFHDLSNIQKSLISINYFYSCVTCRTPASMILVTVRETEKRKLSLWDYGELLWCMNEDLSHPSSTPWNINASIDEIRKSQTSLGFELEKKILLWSCFHGDVDTVKKIMMKYTFQINEDEFLKDTIFLLCCVNRRDDPSLINYLITSFLFDPNLDNNTGVRLACLMGRKNVVKYYLDEVKISFELDENFVLRAATTKGHFEVTKMLLNRQDIDPRDGYSNRPLRNAVRYGHPNIVNLLLKDGKVTKQDSIQARIEVACQTGDLESLKNCLKNPSMDPSLNRNFCIRAAAGYGHVELVRLLINDKRVDVTDEENCAIVHACQENHVGVVKLLLQDGRADPSEDQNFPIRIAATVGHFETVKFLLNDQRVDPSDLDNNPLRYSSRNGHSEIVKMLLNDHRVRGDRKGKLKENVETAIQLAARNDRFEALKVLIGSRIVSEDEKYLMDLVGSEKEKEIVKMASVHSGVGKGFCRFDEMMRKDLEMRIEFLFDDEKMKKLGSHLNHFFSVRIFLKKSSFQNIHKFLFC